MSKKIIYYYYNLGKETTVKENTPNLEKAINTDEIIEQLEKSYRQEVDVPRLTSDYIEQTLQIA